MHPECTGHIEIDESATSWGSSGKDILDTENHRVLEQERLPQGGLEGIPPEDAAPRVNATELRRTLQPHKRREEQQGEETCGEKEGL